jgi:hypothetical protein
MKKENKIKKTDKKLNKRNIPIGDIIFLGVVFSWTFLIDYATYKIMLYDDLSIFLHSILGVVFFGANVLLGYVVGRITFKTKLPNDKCIEEEKE